MSSATSRMRLRTCWTVSSKVASHLHTEPAAIPLRTAKPHGWHSSFTGTSPLGLVCGRFLHYPRCGALEMNGSCRGKTSHGSSTGKDELGDGCRRGRLGVRGAEVTPRLWGPGEPENQLRGPTERLVRSVAAALGLAAELHGEVRLVDRKVRPDYQVNVGRAPVGFIELKRPGKTANPNTYRREDAEQWEKLKLLPNVLYSDGNEWALYRNGRSIGEVAQFNIPLKRAGRKLAFDDGEFVVPAAVSLLEAPTTSHHRSTDRRDCKPMPAAAH